MSRNIDNPYIFKRKSPIIILDAGGLIAGMDIYTPEQIIQVFTSFSIIAEEVKSSVVRSRIDSFILSKNLELVEPPENFYETVKKLSYQSGDLNSLSENDMGILAVSLFLKESYIQQFDCKPDIKLITDDYSVQNIAILLNIETQSYKQPGIKKYIKWQIYCRGCFKVYSPESFGKNCPICGDKIKRRPQKKR